MANKFILIVCIMAFFAVPFPAEAQNNLFNERDDSYPVLGLKRAKGEFEKAQLEYQQAQKLYERDLVSKKSLLDTKADFINAEVNYQQSLLVLLFENQFVAVKEAVKSQDTDGKKYVTLKLANTTGTPAEFKQLLSNTSDDIIQNLDMNTIYNVYISLLNEEQSIIARPYEKKIDRLVAGEPASVRFELLKDADAVTVNLIYGNGSTRSPRVFLQKDDAANRVLMEAETFAQEVELGSSATYKINMELFSSSENTYRLKALNLPESINAHFTDSESEARMSHIKFSENENSRSTNFQLFLPDRATDDIPLDTTLQFYVAAIPTEKQQFLSGMREKKWTEKELRQQKIGFTKLELIPRGVAEMIVEAPQLYLQSLPGESRTFEMAIKNEGTRALRNVEIEADAPLGWRAEITPNAIAEIGVRGEEAVGVSIMPPPEVSVGKYEIRLNTTGVSNNQPLAAITKTITVEIEADTSIWGTIMLVLVTLIVGAGIFWYGIKLSNK